MVDFGENYHDVATSRQIQYVEAVKKYGSYKAAARALGVADSTLRQSLSYLKKKCGIRPEATQKDNIKILVLPDSQVKPDEDYAFLHCQGMYIVDKKPDIIVDLGDFADMPSLSSYDKGKRSYEGRRYKNDIEAARTAMKTRMKPVRDYNLRQLELGLPIYRPRMIMLLGNHENRINRATEIDAMLYGTISVDDLKYESFGWKVIPFLEVIRIHGIAFSHYFTTGAMGRPCTTAQAMLTKKHLSCVAGHLQGLNIATGIRGDGKMITCIIAGSAYDHTEDYLGPQGNAHWRGIIMLHNVQDGTFDPVMIPNHYLSRKYNPKGRKFYHCPKD